MVKNLSSLYYFRDDKNEFDNLCFGVSDHESYIEIFLTSTFDRSIIVEPSQIIEDSNKLIFKTESIEGFVEPLTEKGYIICTQDTNLFFSWNKFLVEMKKNGIFIIKRRNKMTLSKMENDAH